MHPLEGGSEAGDGQASESRDRDMLVDIVSVQTRDGITLHGSHRGARTGVVSALPMPFLGSAATYYDKYGPEERVNMLKHLPNVKLPLLAMHGTTEAATELAMRGVPEELMRLADEIPNFHYAVVPEADHFYTGLRPKAWSIVRDWLMSQS